MIHAFGLEPTTGTYTGVGTFRDRVKVEAPFPVDLDLTRIKTPGHSRVATAPTRTTARHPESAECRAVVSVQRTNTPACPARSRKYWGATPRTTVTATPTAMAVMVRGEGTATVGPLGWGSLKNMRTMTRM